MAINYAKIFNRRATPQSQPIPGSTQVRNSGGGYSWAVDDWTRLDRFLSYGVSLERFQRGHWYRLPARAARELRRLAASLTPLHVTLEALRRSR